MPLMPQWGCLPIPRESFGSVLAKLLPPTFILGTVDKFVRLAHKSKSGNLLFNKETQKSVNLIIQDELHLISGPLGTITGGIEAALDTMLSFWGVKPKYMAATATIRGAANQIKKL